MISLPAAYHGFGIRIEDDVLVKADGYEVLSADIPKEIDEIEKVMK
jgi:Xaa-Pro aminopeptidase